MRFVFGSGGGFSALNASFKSVKPIEVLPTGSAISLAANAEVDLAKLASGDYAVRNETKTTPFRRTGFTHFLDR